MSTNEKKIIGTKTAPVPHLKIMVHTYTGSKYISGTTIRVYGLTEDRAIEEISKLMQRLTEAKDGETKV